MNSLFLTGVSLAILSTCTPQQKSTTLQDVETTALNAGVGYLTGGAPGAIAAAAPSAIQDIQDTAYALRISQNPASAAVPSSAALSSTIALVTASPAVSKSIGPKVASIVASAAKSGIAPSAALESAAVGLDKSAAAAVSATATK